jgi:Endoplasmic reticulum vesicle transporter
MVLPEGLGSTGLYQYFIKVVPTVFRDGNKRKLLTNQYTFTERFRPLMLPDPTSGLLTAVRHHSALLAISLKYPKSYSNFKY